MCVNKHKIFRSINVADDQINILIDLTKGSHRLNQKQTAEISVLFIPFITHATFNCTDSCNINVINENFFYFWERISHFHILALRMIMAMIQHVKHIQNI